MPWPATKIPGDLYYSHGILNFSTIRMPWPANKNSGRSMLQPWHSEFQYYQNAMVAVIQFYD